MFLKNFAELPPRKRIGILAIILGIFAAMIGNPTSKARTTINLKEFALISPKDIASVNVFDLADWIINGKYDYRLIDLREQKEYQKYNIPTSENIQVHNLLDSDLMRNEKIILYSDNDIATAQAWFLLKAEKYNGAYILKGGLKSWENEILFPQCTCGTNPDAKQKQHHAKLAELSKYFGGKMRTGGVEVAQTKMQMPALKMPATIKLKKRKRKRKEKVVNINPTVIN